MPYYGTKRPINIVEKGKARVDTVFYHIPNFKLYNQDGASFSNLSLLNKVWVAGFTSFSGKDAPSLAVTTNRLEERTNLDTGLRIVTFTLDSETAKSMTDYATKIHVAGKRRVFLSGNTEQLQQIATESFYKAVDTAYTNGYIHYFLIDKEGHIRGVYNGMQVKDVDRLVEEIGMMEAEYYVKNQVKEQKEGKDIDAI